MKLNLIMGALLVVCIVVLVWALSAIQFKLENAKSKYESKLGKHVLLGKDTLQVVDYSMFTETLKLENGKEINYEIFKKLEVRK